MRMWMVDPTLLCRQHLLGEHAELHKFRHVFVKGYSIAGRLGQIEPAKMEARHDELAAEMLRRGYRHQSPYTQPSLDHLPLRDRQGRVNPYDSLEDLQQRCGDCRQRIAGTVVRCACGKTYSKEQWEKLRYVGVQPDIPPYPDLELRDCVCGSTLSVEVAGEKDD